ncbi:hypothetical protein PV08_03117 [Exophiala spinifera]|uniref:DUF6604 domain-containing protein n=1 Tax=Exophiala spinifera TaxID=91928 RepID=A0A0D2BIR9_9EURO|nr:uncharacterized protein PV08_03117 [Exophiala spinifera]KIW18828.1 hypothetical protein PV08_03117 [Exophiala spinifera]
MGIFCPEIRELQAAYKPATDRVLNWIKNVSDVPRSKWGTTSVNYHLTLAERLVRCGTPMPEDVLFELNTAIDRRQQAADILAKHGSADQRHEHMIQTLMRILDLFCPSSPPISPEMEGQEQLYAVPSFSLPQEWWRCPSPAEDSNRFVQQQFFLPPPPPPGFYPGVHLAYGNPAPGHFHYVAGNP